MPAILPARLKQQSSDLVAKFAQPAAFVSSLHALLDHYSDHTHRKGLAGEPSPLITFYKAPPPVMRQVWQDLSPRTKTHPAEIFTLCDALWAEPNLDLQLLAARLLGKLPVKPVDPVIDRLNIWISQGLDRRILDGLFEFGLERLQQESPNIVLELISSWMSSTETSIQQAGLRALLSIISLSDTERLPSIFTLLTPFLRMAPSRLRPDILAVLSALVKASPSEAAFILRQNLTVPDNPDTAWLIRQVLGEFPKEIQSGLRQAMKEARK